MPPSGSLEQLGKRQLEPAVYHRAGRDQIVTTLTLPRLTAHGHEVQTQPDRFGELRSSAHVVEDVEALRERMREDGYLYLPGYLDRELVLEARREVTARLAADGLLDPDFPAMEAVASKNPPPGKRGVRNDIARGSAAVQRVLYTGQMMEFYRRFLPATRTGGPASRTGGEAGTLAGNPGGDVLHFDYTWLRAITPGRAAAPHCDIVFMGRGTKNLYTAWTPMGDISYEMGGLMMLEDSHQLERVRNTYGQMDVDSYCENRPSGEFYASGQKRWSGHLSKNAPRLRDKLGGRWLTTEFRAGDLLTFGMFTVHASLDNQSDRVRLSSDSRYQLASEPADHRWMGEQPIAHGPAGKRGRIC